VSNRKNNTFLVLYFLYSIVQKTRSLFHTKCKYWYIPVSKIAKKNNLKECVFNIGDFAHWDMYTGCPTYNYNE